MSALPPELDGLSYALVVKLRGHGHLCNVLTHVGSGNWRAIEQAIGTILRPRVRAAHLSAIDRNIVELIADARGTTGPIMQSVFFDTIAHEIGARRAKRIARRIMGLRKRMRSESRGSRSRDLKQPPQREVSDIKHSNITTAAPHPRELGKAA